MNKQNFCKLTVITYYLIFTISNALPPKKEMLAEILAYNPAIEVTDSSILFLLKLGLHDVKDINDLCKLSKTIPFFIPEAWIEESDCTICYDAENNSKKNLSCCGQILCVPCLRKIYAYHKAIKLESSKIFSCPFCKQKMFSFPSTGKLSILDLHQKRLYQRLTKKDSLEAAIKKEIKIHKAEQIQESLEDAQAAESMYQRSLAEATAGDEAFARQIADQWRDEEE